MRENAVPLYLVLCLSLLRSSSAWNILSKRKMQEEFGNSHGCSLFFYVMLLLLTIVKMTLKKSKVYIS